MEWVRLGASRVIAALEEPATERTSSPASERATTHSSPISSKPLSAKSLVNLPTKDDSNTSENRAESRPPLIIATVLQEIEAPKAKVVAHQAVMRQGLKPAKRVPPKSLPFPARCRTREGKPSVSKESRHLPYTTTRYGSVSSTVTVHRSLTRIKG